MSDYVRIRPYHLNGHVYYFDIAGLRPEAVQLEFEGAFLADIGDPLIRFKNRSAKSIDYVMGIGHFPVISDRFKTVLEDLPDSRFVQFIPCKTNHAKPQLRFWIMNVLELVDAFDWERSDYIKRTYANDPNRYWPDEIKRVELLEENIGGRNIFRITDHPTSLFVSQHLAQIIVAEKLLVTLTRTPDLTQGVDAHPDDPGRALWGHKGIR